MPNKTCSGMKKNILEAVGNTPIVRLNEVAKDIPIELGAKLEFLSPGGSIKDRLGWYLIEDAEKKGLLKPGGTVVECTSGNTGFALGMAAAVKGYKSVFVLPDKISLEKINNLRAFGARVEVTPTDVEPNDPRSYYSVAKRIASETPNSVWLNQYDNLANRECHYKFTGPELLEQIPDLDYFFAGIGTGGTVCGIAKYLKEKRPSCKVVAIDPEGSIVRDYFYGKTDTKAHTYKVEGIGEDFIPKNYDFSVIDDIITVGDKESMHMTRDLLRKEGIYAGSSSGAAVVGALKYMHEKGVEKFRGKKGVVILPDGGLRYLSKAFNDQWMKENQFL